MPYEFSGFPRRENTACVSALRTLVIVPEAESPSVMKIAESSRRSSFCLGFQWVVIVHSAVAELAVVEADFLRFLSCEFCHASHCLPFFLA